MKLEPQPKPEIPPPNRIAELREARGWTQGELAAEVNTSPQQIGHLEAGRRNLTLAWMKRLAPALGCAPADLIISDNNAVTVRAAEPEGAVGRLVAETTDIPVFGSIGAATGHSRSVIVERIPRFQALKSAAGIYGLFVQNDEMKPAFRAGDPIVVNPHRSPAVGDYAIAWTADDEEILGLVEERSRTEITLVQFNPLTQIPIKLNEIKALHRVYWWAEIILP